MALHRTTIQLLKESLPEFLHVAEYCIGFRKPDGGCLGYPGAAVLFSIADSLGSYHRGRTDFTVPVDGANVSIKSQGYHHLFIFNSRFYGFDLSEAEIKKLYANYRCLLLHNSALANDHFLFLEKPESPAFVTDRSGIHVNVAGLLRVTKMAVSAFLNDIDRIVQNSKQLEIIGRKR
ncbi:MAG: hypothetical protein ABS70_04860 [Nitrospira sp. SCN 59-13]|nr:MAG: hypothetical protein ABS70_04860 [Nitrospira sp. SCN 59-13]